MPNVELTVQPDLLTASFPPVLSDRAFVWSDLKPLVQLAAQEQQSGARGSSVPSAPAPSESTAIDPGPRDDLYAGLSSPAQQARINAASAQNAPPETIVPFDVDGGGTAADPWVAPSQRAARDVGSTDIPRSVYRREDAAPNPRTVFPPADGRTPGGATEMPSADIRIADRAQMVASETRLLSTSPDPSFATSALSALDLPVGEGGIIPSFILNAAMIPGWPPPRPFDPPPLKTLIQAGTAVPDAEAVLERIAERSGASRAAQLGSLLKRTSRRRRHRILAALAAVMDMIDGVLSAIEQELLVATQPLGTDADVTIAGLRRQLTA